MTLEEFINQIVKETKVLRPNLDAMKLEIEYIDFFSYSKTVDVGFTRENKLIVNDA